MLGSQAGLCWLFSLVCMAKEEAFYSQDSFEFREAGVFVKVHVTCGKGVGGMRVMQYMMAVSCFIAFIGALVLHIKKRSFQLACME